MRVGSMLACTNPAAPSLDLYSTSSNAPAMQPTHNNMSRRNRSGTAPRVTTSDTVNRPPGFRTRNLADHLILVGIGRNRISRRLEI
jgi:hypothetical protein